ncbi:MAG: hypothetical protein JKP92_06010 [Alphaproteobacteria bacterium]|jgi:hypothetical protein|nr:hypothetical protein [Alphaproteobacteria bacterium]
MTTDLPIYDPIFWGNGCLIALFDGKPEIVAKLAPRYDEFSITMTAAYTPPRTRKNRDDLYEMVTKDDGTISALGRSSFTEQEARSMAETLFFQSARHAEYMKLKLAA